MSKMINPELYSFKTITQYRIIFSTNKHGTQNYTFYKHLHSTKSGIMVKVLRYLDLYLLHTKNLHNAKLYRYNHYQNPDFYSLQPSKEP